MDKTEAILAGLLDIHRLDSAMNEEVREFLMACQRKDSIDADARRQKIHDLLDSSLDAVAATYTVAAMR